MPNESLDATIASIASKTTYSGAGTSVLGWTLSSEFGVLMGIVIGLAGLIVNVYFKAREDRRLEAEHAARMRVP